MLWISTSLLYKGSLELSLFVLQWCSAQNFKLTHGDSLKNRFNYRHRHNGQGRMEWKVPPSPSSRPASGTTLALPEDLTGGDPGTPQGLSFIGLERVLSSR